MYQSAVTDLIVRRYRDVHDAAPCLTYGSHITVGDDEAPAAALGYRQADSAALFLERYLDQPVEQVVAARLGRSVDRSRIVEIGDHASANSRATLALWARAADELRGKADIAVAVLTAPLRAMFDRIGLEIGVIGPASRDRVGEQGAAWGRYYDCDPQVCAGDIALGRERISQWVAQRRERRA
jgi:hypothetical protein